MKHKQEKLERPERLAELQPAETLGRVGFEDGQVLADIGAGSGIFAIPAARMTADTVYALDTDPEMLRIIDGKAQREGLTNIKLVQVSGDCFDIEAGAVDLALLVTVLHEIGDKATMLEEIGRILKTGGRILVIEFNKRETSMGPPMAIRLEECETEAVLAAAGFRRTDGFELGGNMYGLVFTKAE